MIRLLVNVLISFVLLGSVPLVQAANNQLTITGSSTVAPLALEIGKRFEKQHPGVRVNVQTGGSTRGVHDAVMGLADIGMASRDLKPSEQGLRVYTLAMDGVCVILNKANPVTTLSNAEIVDIYTGKIRNWKTVGGKDSPITVVNKAEGHSTLELFLHYFALKNSQVKPDVIIGDNEQGIKTVTGNPGAIGYVSIGTAEYDEQQGVPIKRLPMEGVAASVATVRAKQFPLARPLNLLTKGEPSRLARKFLDFAQSEAVDDLIQAQYFVPLH